MDIAILHLPVNEGKFDVLTKDLMVVSRPFKAIHIVNIIGPLEGM